MAKLDFEAMLLTASELGDLVAEMQRQMGADELDDMTPTQLVLVLFAVGERVREATLLAVLEWANHQAGMMNPAVYFGLKDQLREAGILGDGEQR